jgi:mono/diheme cytochrome c family protein
MLPVSLSIAQLPEEDAQAMADYILSLRGAGAKAGPDCAASTSAVPDNAAGAALFVGACAGCHGGGAPMRTIDGRPGLGVVSAATADTPRNLIKTLLEGIPMSPRAPSHYMPAFADSLDDSHIAALAGYLRSQACAAQPWADLEKTVTTIRQEGASK